MAEIGAFDQPFNTKLTKVKSNTSNFYNAIEIQNSLGQINGKFCRAFWWKGPGTVTGDSFNVSIIYDYGASLGYGALGLYDFVFTNSMPSADYTVIVSANHSRDINGNRIFLHLRNRASNAFRVETVGGNGETGTFDAVDMACIVYSN